MVFALVFVSVALVVSLGFLLLGSKERTASSPAAQGQLEAEGKARQAAEADLERKRKEVEELKASLGEVKDQLKQAKRKLYEQKEADKGPSDLAKEREQVERQASMQLEVVRAELATALGEIEKLKLEGKARKAAPAEAPAPEKVHKVIRELSEADKEKMQRLEQQAGKDRARAGELERELKSLKGRLETQNRFHKTTRSELELVKDKFRALEKRLNRTLLERDLLVRAIKDLEKKSGISAERIELSPEEVAASDQAVEERQRAEEKASAERQAQATQEAEQALQRAADPVPPPGSPEEDTQAQSAG